VGNYNSPTPTNLAAAELDFDNALGFVRGQILADGTDVGLGNIAGLTITPGLYVWNTAVTVRATF
jgi:hypothetical protein